MANRRFTKILIANRGEIACRVIATARRMGIGTVAVFSDADAYSRHAQMADEAVHIGPAAASESYLSTEKIITAAKATGAEAIHPGYGFLSENADFAEAVAAARLVFIGPPASAIRAMGLKDAAKRAMEEAGVPVVPGYHGSNQDTEFLANEAGRIGYPVLIKARAGGGGKGMRLVETPTEFIAALEGAQREAQASFGDPACLIEKFVTQPRHIEIQVFGDSQGNVVHLFERDCSLQRRHQKVIEEAPAPGMTEAVRDAMGHAAVEAAKAIGYQGAGTVEFIVDGSDGLHVDRFWFMEMNTRLQVEHPVTEAITGLDLVELQLHVAAGEALPFTQDDLKIKGHAFEARIYAEDVPKGFLPATGVLNHLSFPAASEFEIGTIRIDSGVREYDKITPFYDPMVAKLIVHGSDRVEAFKRLSSALADCHVAGATTNIEFLRALARHNGFGRGDVNTGLIARDLETLATDHPPTEEINAIAALLALGLLDEPLSNDPWSSLKNWRLWSDAEAFITLEFEGEKLERKILALPTQAFRIDGGNAPLQIQAERIDQNTLRFSYAGIVRRVSFHKTKRSITIFADSRIHQYDIHDPLEGDPETGGSGDTILAPMPGQIRRVGVKSGEQVKRGQKVLILEAMKMEHTLTAPRDGQIAELFAVEGDQVKSGAVLATLIPQNADG